MAFTIRDLQAIPVRAQAFVIHDPKLWAFGCRIAPGGARAWVVEYRPNGGGRRQSTKRLTLGRLEALSMDQARTEAKRILALVRLGEDPAGDRRDRREAATVGEIADAYMLQEIRPLRKASTAGLYAIYLEIHVRPAIGGRKAIDITRPDLAKLHRKIGETAMPTANRVLVFLSGMFSWASSSGLIPEGSNPAKGIGHFKEEGRERFLSAEELARLGAAMREAETIGLPWDKPDGPRTVSGPHAVAAIRLLLFTGARLREILHLRWDEIDLDRHVLMLPDSKTGKKTISLSAPALLVIEGLSRAGVYVIASSDPEKPRHDLQRPWAAITKRAGLPGLRIHDLRHSFASVGVAGNHGLPVIGSLLGHASPETTAKYAHFADSPRKRAADQIAGTISIAMGDQQETADVVPFETRRR